MKARAQAPTAEVHGTVQQVEPRGPSPFWWLRPLRRPFGLRSRYEHHLRIFPTPFTRFWLVVGLAAALSAPISLSSFWIGILNLSMIASIGAIGLNLLTGYTGQISLGHAFFLGLGAYTAAYLGGDLGWPFPVWLAVAGLLGLVVGILIGPFALRLKGLYLAIVTLGLVFLGLHLFRSVRFITGGPPGRTVPSPMIGETNLADWNRSFGIPLNREQSFYYLLVPILAAAALFAKNVVRSRPGRAFQAIRDREIAAAVIGVNVARYKVAAFALSSFYTAAAGALLGSYLRFASPGQYNLLVSIEYVAMIIVGGIGSIFGSILGAFFIVLIPHLVEEFSVYLPFVSPGGGGGLSIHVLNQMLFGLLIVVFLLKEPLGMAGIWLRLKIYFKSWPFSY